MYREIDLNEGEVRTIYHALGDLLPNLVEGDYKMLTQELQTKFWNLLQSFNN